mgnify:CR=1 FL=1
MNFLAHYDMIFLNELKTALPFSLPGYQCYRSMGDHTHRGGCAILLRHALSRYISHVDNTDADMVSLSLNILPDVTFVSCYLPPSDSPFFSLSNVSKIQHMLETMPTKKVVLMGDLNSRFANKMPTAATDAISYTQSPDPIRYPNYNARCISAAWESLVIVNNVKYKGKSFKGNLTFKQGMRWTSELDYGMLTLNALDSVTAFEVHQTPSLPSNHAPLSLTIDTQILQPHAELNDLCQRAEELGDHAVLHTNSTRRGGRCRKQIRMSSINREAFREALIANDPPDINDATINESIALVNEIMYTNAVNSSANAPRRSDGNNSQSLRWKNLIDSNDHKAIWQAINWRGSISGPQLDHPSDESFKAHFEQLLNSSCASTPQSGIVNSNVYIPITDDPIMPDEVMEATKRIKSNRSGGPSGIPPGVLKCLPQNWLLFFTDLFNCIFATGTYPDDWALARLIALHKKGPTQDCGNYRGISIMDTCAKLYDMILGARLERWFKPNAAQAGAQRGRGCLEHIMSLRLLCDYAVSKRKRLFCIFVDFSKAYDRVPRDKLLNQLAEAGCGARMVAALSVIYRNTAAVLGTQTITSSMGVRQGSPTSCFLFTFYVNQLLQMLQEQCPPDDFLAETHALMLMDDTVLLATDRESAEKKVEILMSFCEQSGMSINASKTKFFVLNGHPSDSIAFTTTKGLISTCESYVYLGAHFTSNGKLSSAITNHCSTKMAHVTKFNAFVQRNCDFPYSIKEKVLIACLMSALLYSSESWLTGNLRQVQVLYMSVIKSLLSVRKTTPNDLCLIESSLPPLMSKVKEMQRSFLQKMTADTAPADTPFAYAWRLSTSCNPVTPCARYAQSVLSEAPSKDYDALLERVRSAQGSRAQTYRDVFNRELAPNTIYQTPTLAEYKRIVLTRLRLSSHNLAVETGRWSRIPLEQRLCPCGSVQTELHILFECSQTEHVRTIYPDVPRDFSNIPPEILCDFAYSCYVVY